jgi:hypothetical protein
MKRYLIEVLVALATRDKRDLMQLTACIHVVDVEAVK